MITQPARVIEVTNSSYILETLPKSACPRCAAGKGCGGGILAQAFANKTYRMKLTKFEQTDHSVNEMVQIGIDSNGLLWASMALYLLPLMLMIIGAYAVGSFGQYSDGFTLSGAIIGVVIGAVIAKRVSRNLIESNITQPFIIDKPTESCWYPAK